MIKQKRRGDFVNSNSNNVEKSFAHEMADIVIYLDLLAARMKIDLGAAVREKFNVVSDWKSSKIKL